MLATRRKNVADLEKERAIESAPRFNRRLEEERKEIRKLKKQLRDLGVKVDDSPLDGDPSLRRLPRSNSPPKKAGKKDAISESKKEEPPNIIWIAGLFLISIFAATAVSLVVVDVYKITLVFIFTLLTLGILLPFIALRYNFLSEVRWLRSYIATLEKIPMLDTIIKTFRKK